LQSILKKELTRIEDISCELSSNLLIVFKKIIQGRIRNLC